LSEAELEVDTSSVEESLEDDEDELSVLSQDERKRIERMMSRCFTWFPISV